MRTVSLYLVALLVGLSTIAIGAFGDSWMGNSPAARLVVECGLAGGFGGLVYCLRGIYLSASVRKDWDPIWLPWYYLRPLVSIVVGGASSFFLRAGLFVLEAKSSTESSNLGFYALAFIAGLNVDRFLAKLEDVAKATWGIRPSRTSESSAPSTDS